MTTTTLYPDATDTGVPAGTQLVAATSNDITKPGVYSGLVFTGTVQIECSGVTLENCVVKDTPSDWVGVVVSGNVQNVVIQNCEIAGAGSNSTVTGTYGIAVQDDSQVSILNNNIHDVGSPFAIGAGQVVIEGNYAHDFYSGPGTHYNGIQVNGGNGADFSLLMENNTIINNQPQTDAIMLDNELGPIHNVTITNNLLVGGDYTVYVDGSKSSSPVTDVNISNNHLGSGIYGYWYLASDGLSSANYQVTTSGNVDDGAALAASINTAANQTTGTGGGSTTSSASGSSSTQTGDVTPDAPVITKDTVVSNTVQVSGTADAGDTIKLYDGSTLVGTTKAASNGAWSLTTSALTQGTHTLTASETDAAGDTSGLSQAVKPVIASSTPSSPPADTAPDAPVITKDAVVSNTVQVSGTADAGDTIKLYDGSTLVGTTKAASNGAWSLTTSALTQGTHTLTASETDAAGDTSGLSQAVKPVIASSTPSSPPADTAPDAPVITKDAVVSNTVQVSGTADAGDTIKLYDGSTLVGTTKAASNGAWSLTTSALTQGTHTLTASETDAAGDTSGLSQAVKPVIASSTPSSPPADTAPDAPVITKDTVVSNTVQVSGTADAGDTIKVYDGTTLLGTTHTAADGDWSLTTSALSQGTHTLTATATDAAGNTSHQSQAVDPLIGSTSSGQHSSSPPDAPVITADTVVGHAVQMSGTAEDGSTIKLYNGSTLLGTTHAASDGDWSFTTPALSQGAHTLTASSTDAAGNTSALSEAVDPVIGRGSSNGGGTSTHNHLTGSSETLLQFTGVQQNHDNTVTLTGTADLGTPLSIYDGAKAVGSATTDTDGNWTFTTSASPNQVHSYTASLIDNTGDTVATTTGAAVVGTNSGEKLLSTSGDDILTGKGGADTFVFAANFGHDTITNFTAQGAGHDTIDLSHSVFDTFASVLSHASQDGQNVVISAGSDTLTLKNMKLGALNSHDFHFG